MSLLESIKLSSALVMNQANYVRVNEDRLAKYAETLVTQTFDLPFYDPNYHYVGTDKDTATYLVCLDTINFGSGYFPYLKKRAGMSGYFTVASALKDWFESGIPSVESLTALTTSECAALFQQPFAHPKNRELITLFTKALNDLGRLLLEKYDASFTALLESANHNAETLMLLLNDMDYFKDISYYKGMSVPIYKRAQIMPSDLFLALKGQGLGYFKDIDNLTIFADNLVPHVLKVDGVLSYSPELLMLIEVPLASGSEAEVEIRCAAIYAVELMVSHLQAQGIKTTSRILDMLLWNRGLADIYRQSPRHRTFTVFY